MDKNFFSSGFLMYLVSSQQYFLPMALLASAQPLAVWTTPVMGSPVVQGLPQPPGEVGEPICTPATVRSWTQQSQDEHRRT